MTQDVQQAVDQLHDKLPLKGRQATLAPELRELHRAVLKSFPERGRPLNRSEVGALLGDIDAGLALDTLAKLDLVVLDADGREVLGAYPMTSEDTPHNITLGGHSFHAMCALDSVSIAPMFKAEVLIESRCQVTGEAIRIRQRELELLEACPGSDIRIGVRWQDPTACAAHSLCMEMVFLKDLATARQWQGGDTVNYSLFTLPEAVVFGAAFFVPLLEDQANLSAARFVAALRDGGRVPACL